MASNMDTTEGQTSFVSAREDAWHQLGTTLPETFTAEDAMEHGLLGGWNVRKAPIMADLGEGTSPLLMPDRFAVVRDNPVKNGQVDVIGNVGKAYHVIQNEEHAELLNTIVDESGAHFETAGAIDGGRRVFITMKLPGHVNIAGVDRVEHYLAAVNSHDGSTAFTLMVTPVRIVCQNTLTAAFGNNSHAFRVKHTSNASKALVQQARESLELTFKYLDGFQEQADRLINTTVSQATFEQIIQQEFGAGEEAAPATHTRADTRLAEMSRLFNEAGTQQEIRGTAWAGFNALAEWADHYSPARGDAPDTTRAIRSALDDTFKNRALDLMLAKA